MTPPAFPVETRPTTPASGQMPATAHPHRERFSSLTRGDKALLTLTRCNSTVGLVERKLARVNAPGQSTVFGRRKEPHTVIIAHGDEIRHFTVRPWMAACLGSAVAAVVVGYLMATSYLVLR